MLGDHMVISEDFPRRRPHRGRPTWKWPLPTNHQSL